MTLNKIPLPLLAGLLTVALPLHGDLLLTYTEFENNEGGQITTPTTAAPGIIGSEIGLTDGNLTTGEFNAADWSSPLPYLQGGSGWDETDPAGAKAFTFGMEAEPGEVFSLVEFRFEDRATGAGPSAMGVWINGTQVFARHVADSENEVNAIDLAGFSLDALTEAEFVVAGWDDGSRDTSGGGQWRTAGYEVRGAVAPIPEPSTWALLTGLACLAGTLAHRRRRNR